MEADCKENNESQEIITIDWIIRSNKDHNERHQMDVDIILEDLDNADDLALLASTVWLYAPNRV